jgi:hypothetical protein
LVDVKAYFGLQFLADGETHYGWALMENFNYNGGVIYDYAYETVAGKPIFTGVVPEPSTWALIITGGIFVGWRMRRRARCSS